MDNDLYHARILELARDTSTEGRLETPTASATINNPLCGDKVTVYVKLDGDRIADARFDARGCAISVASASMMTEILKGLTASEAVSTFDRFQSQLTSKETPELAEDDELAALMGVRDFPTRIKCATLPWHTFQAALAGSDENQITTE